MEKCIDYDILAEPSAGSLAIGVKALIDQGWEPYGRSYIVAAQVSMTGPDQFPAYQYFHYQTMVKMQLSP